MGVTRSDVARRAGVSTAVVSYVVNGGPRPVSAKARAAVEQAIAELGYKPNVLARALKGGSSGSIGLLLPDQINPYFAELTEALEREQRARGTLVLVGVIGRASDRADKYVDLLLSRSVDGIVSVGNLGASESIERAGGRVPLIYVDRAPGSTTYPTITTNGVGGAVLAVEHLQAHGHTTIGCIAGPPGLPVSDDRIEGWKSHLTGETSIRASDLLAHGDFTAAGGFRAAMSVLGPDGRRAAARTPRPTGLFVLSDIQATGVIRACDRLGLRIPEDVAVVSFDGTKAGEYAQPPLTSIRQPIDMMAQVVAGLLDGSRDSGAQLDGNLVVRRSCGCPG